MPRRRARDRLPPVRFRMTRAGWLFLVVSVLVGLAAIRSQTPMMYVLFGGMMGALHISAVLARRMVSAVRVGREAPGRVWQHQVVHIGYFIRNARRRECLGLRLAQMAPEGIESTGGYCAHLAGGGSFRSGARFVARQRGRFAFRGVRVSTLFPFGLIEAHRTLSEGSSLVVWPGRGTLKRRLLRRGAVEVSRGAPSLVTGGQDEFFGLREYREGDHARWIHWRRSAGRETPVIRELSRPLPEVLYVVLETADRDPTELGRFARERRIRFAATLIDYAFARGYQVGLAVGAGGGSRVFAPRAGRGQRRDLLDALADVDPSGAPLETVLAGLDRRHLAEAQVVVVTGQDEGLSDALLRPLRTAARQVRVVYERTLWSFFEDQPPLRDDREAGHAA